MLRNSLYYALRPWIPQSVRFAIRRPFAMRMRRNLRSEWPIKPGSERPPDHWNGWPEGKRFAFVLTHDVESQRGLENVQPLAEVEMQYGFRSKFNFIPEGPYSVPESLRRWLTDHGFEIGVHDLHHDGRLYSSYRKFRQSASRINEYLKAWDATGFRSGFMLHRLDWLHALNITYDCSTFDTDPFEPQPDGCHTIFPFWVARPGFPLDNSTGKYRNGYVELPYTLPQDSTLFLLLQERTSNIWRKKLDWIAQNGGMALVNIHPDYVRFDGGGARRTEYPLERIRELLSYVAEKYTDSSWSALPGNVASWYEREYADRRKAAMRLPQDLATGARSEITRRPLEGKRAGVLLYSYYPADPRPRRAAEAMVAAGATVDLLCLREDESEPKHEVVNNVNVWRLPMRRRRESKFTYLIQYGRFLAAAFSFLARRSINARYSVVHVHNMPDVLVFAAAIPKFLGARVILDLHDPMPELMTSIYGLASDHWMVRLLRTLERASLAFADLALTPNLTFLRLFESRSCPPGKMQIVMNSPEGDIFDPDRFENEPADPQPGNDAFRVVHHGSIVHRHGVDLLVRAVAEIRGRIPGVRLDIYGSRTPFLETVLQVAAECGVEDIVHFHGPKAQAEIAQEIRSCHVGVVPNRPSPFTELNFPTRLFEYLAMRRPVIAPATTGITDYFGPQELLFFQAGSVESLAQQLLWVHANPKLTAQFVERGREVYRRNLWSAEKSRFLARVGELLITPESPRKTVAEAATSSCLPAEPAMPGATAGTPAEL